MWASVLNDTIDKTNMINNVYNFVGDDDLKKK